MCPTCLLLTQEVDDLRVAAASTPRGRARNDLMRAKLQLAAHLAVAHSDAPDVDPPVEAGVEPVAEAVAEPFVVPIAAPIAAVVETPADADADADGTRFADPHGRSDDGTVGDVTPAVSDTERTVADRDFWEPTWELPPATLLLGGTGDAGPEDPAANGEQSLEWLWPLFAEENPERERRSGSDRRRQRRGEASGRRESDQPAVAGEGRRWWQRRQG